MAAFWPRFCELVSLVIHAFLVQLSAKPLFQAGKYSYARKEKKGKKLRRQSRLSYGNEGKGDTLAQKSRKSPPPQSRNKKG
eukprot:1148330-Pelagomonas_calceolata.AAC.1